MTKIHRLGQYFIEVWKAAGIEKYGNVEFLWASDVIGKNPNYWELVMDISQTFTVTRMKRYVSPYPPLAYFTFPDALKLWDVLMKRA